MEREDYMREALALARELNGGKDLPALLMPHGANTMPKLQ